MTQTPPMPPGPGKEPGDPMERYHNIADTVGGVPTLRLKDNLVQTIVVLASAALGALVGCGLVWGNVIDWELWIGAAAGGVGGLILGTFVSGLVLMVLGGFGRRSGSEDRPASSHTFGQTLARPLAHYRKVLLRKEVPVKDLFNTSLRAAGRGTGCGGLVRRSAPGGFDGFRVGGSDGCTHQRLGRHALVAAQPAPGPSWRWRMTTPPVSAR